MTIKRAKTLSDKQISFVRSHLAYSDNSLRDTVMFLLSFKAGLRAAEIAGLRWENVTDAEGKLSKIIWIGSHIAKNSRSRQVPMHPELRTALMSLRMMRPKDECIAYSIRPGYKVMSANAVTLWFKRMYEDIGFEGCSSHSGRRSAITKLARIANNHNCSLVDVQRFAGHARLDTTERYINFSNNAPAMVSAL